MDEIENRKTIETILESKANSSKNISKTNKSLVGVRNKRHKLTVLRMKEGTLLPILPTCKGKEYVAWTAEPGHLTTEMNGWLFWKAQVPKLTQEEVESLNSLTSITLIDRVDIFP